MNQPSLLEQLTRPKRALSVSELSSKIKTLVEGRFLDVWIEGEISNFRSHSSGHWYFSLKDQSAMVRCVCFRMQTRLIRFTPADGMKVRARGRVSVYEARSEYQVLVEFIEPAGLGALQMAFEQLKTRLEAEGLFASVRKRPLPMLPRRIGVVTSPTGAAIRDVLRTIKRRNESISVLIAPVRVQGAGAELEIAEGIRALNTAGVDVIIVARGGGSVEDLSCFNTEGVARAIYSSNAPVISAVGHETDFTIADFVADLRASTPSAASEMVAAVRDEMSAKINALSQRLASRMRYKLLHLKNVCGHLRSSRSFDSVSLSIKNARQRFDELDYRMELSLWRTIKDQKASLNGLTGRLRETDVRRTLINRRAALARFEAKLASTSSALVARYGERLSIAAGKLQSLSPLSVLARGYAIAFDDGGRVLKTALDVTAGDRIRVRLSDGEIGAIVDETLDKAES
ncbi:MAG TPA: exodeoxyribonuclease VII large subunit [Blastocatellia bacterium]|nr:exodeoxyribonuclease VII large subunit [Blastocatellia bacterium]